MEENKEVKKLSYEQLEEVAKQLSTQVQQLYAKLQETNVQGIFKRLDYLFKVIEFKDAFNEEFVTQCSEEIEGIINIKDDKSEDKENKSK